MMPLYKLPPQIRDEVTRQTDEYFVQLLRVERNILHKLHLIGQLQTPSNKEKRNKLEGELAIVQAFINDSSRYAASIFFADPPEHFEP